MQITLTPIGYVKCPRTEIEDDNWGDVISQIRITSYNVCYTKLLRDGRRKLFNIQYQTFPIGLLSLICKTFNNAGINTEIISNRKNASNNISYHMNNTFEMRDYQTQAVIASILHGNGIIKAATGAGKTTIAARTIGGLRGRAIFIVPTRITSYNVCYTKLLRFMRWVLAQW